MAPTPNSAFHSIPPGAMHISAPLMWSVDTSLLAPDELAGFNHERGLALAELGELIEFRRKFRYPAAPDLPLFRRGTSSGALQFFRRLLAYNDIRGLSDSDEYVRTTGLGSLKFAVDRAIARHTMRERTGSAPVLTIGAGQRLTELGLKTLYDDQVTMHEVSPRFARTQGAVDVEVAEDKIEDVVLPPASFEFAYSIMGSYYAKDQIDVLQRVVDGLRVGGELFLMWPWSRQNRHHAGLVDRWSGFFHHKGLDIGAKTFTEDGFNPFKNPRMILVWARKGSADVDVGAAFQVAAELDKVGLVGGQVQYPPVFRLAMGGSYFGAHMVTQQNLVPVVESMVDIVCKAYETDPGTLLYKMSGRRMNGIACEEARHELAQLLIGEQRFKLKDNFPLTTTILSSLSPALAILDTDSTVQAERDTAKRVRMKAMNNMVGPGRF